MLKRGRIPSAKEIQGIRELSREDLEHLREKRPPGIVQRLRDPHHMLARLIATGLRLNEAAVRAGYSYSRAQDLVKDPAFQQLVAEYRKEVHANWLENVDEFAQTSVANMMKAERQIAEHLDKADEEGELLPLKTLASITADRADRFGYGKKQTNVNVNLDFAAQLEKAIKRSSAAPRGLSDGGLTHPRLVEHQPRSSPVADVDAPRPFEASASTREPRAMGAVATSRQPHAAPRPSADGPIRRRA